MNNQNLINYQNILEEARVISGLDDFGDLTHMQGLQELCWSLNHEANLNDIGRMAQVSRITGI